MKVSKPDVKNEKYLFTTDSWKEEKDLPGWTHREIAKNEIILEPEIQGEKDVAKAQKFSNEIWLEKIKPVLKMKKIPYTLWFSGNKSLHCHIAFDKNLSVEEKVAWVKENFESSYSKLDEALFNQTKHMILGENKINAKSGKEKTLIEGELKKTVFTLKNPITAKESKISVNEDSFGAAEILEMKNPSEDQRVKCVMKLFNAHRPKWKSEQKQEAIDNICEQIALRKKWEDYKPEITRNKITKYVSGYFDKPNPNEEEKKITLKLKSASDLFKFKPRKDFIIDQFIYPQNIIMIYSPPKNYKSLLALKICMDVANGKKFFGLKTKKTNVLYCDRENNETLIHQRLHALKKGSPKQYQRKNFPLHFLIRQGDLENDFWIDQLIETIRERKIKLVVFDTMKRYSTNFDENSANDVNRIYTKAYQPLIDECDCSIIFLHHTNKDGQFRGSGDFLGLVDSAYSISKTKNEFKISCLAARGGEIDEIQGSVDIEQDSHKQLTSFEFIQKSREEIEEAASEAWVKLKTACDLIMRHFLSNGLDSYQKKDIENAILLEQKGQISPTTIKRAFKHLVFKKILMTDGRGKYTKIGEWL